MKTNKWIEKKRIESKKLLEEADKARLESNFCDIDALEQYVYNKAVLDLLEELEKVRRP
jgi:hypothetical protein